MKHECLPTGKTPENLAVWIMENNAGEIQHIEKTPLGPEKIAELEHTSSLASRAIDRLETIKKEFMEVLTGGTNDEETPYDTTIPPTKGLKILKANRAFADKQIEQEFSEETITLYLIPWTSMNIMVATDIEGFEWPEYTKPMTQEQINSYVPIVKVPKKKKEKQLSFIEDGPTDDAEEVTDLDL